MMSLIVRMICLTLSMKSVLHAFKPQDLILYIYEPQESADQSSVMGNKKTGCNTVISDQIINSTWIGNNTLVTQELLVPFWTRI